MCGSTARPVRDRGDAGSNQISVLRILPGGLLALVRGGVVPSAGVLPLGVAVHGKLVYVVNAGTGGSNYTGFRLTPAGRLAPVPGSTVALPSGSQPGDVLFNGTGAKRAGTRVGTSQIDSFTVGPDARRRAHRSRPRAWAGSAASSGRPTPIRCSCPTPTTPPSTAAPSRRSPTPERHAPPGDRLPVR
jgi:hypothetical protein